MKRTMHRMMTSYSNHEIWRQYFMKYGLNSHDHLILVLSVIFKL